MAAVAKGDREALARLYDRHAEVVLALIHRIVRDGALAEDLLHDVFLEAWHHAAGYDPQRGSVRTWIMIRARSRALDRRGKLARDADVALRAGGSRRGPPTARPTSSASTARACGAWRPGWTPSWCG
jgi:RNA polymerase sigma-70 factor (ECF subfamily)